MASRKKQGRTMESELIAIYRLKFYKNKKDWKLGTDDRETSSPSKKCDSNKQKLNKTYDLEEEAEAEAEQAPALNKAFLELSVNKDQTPPLSPTLSRKSPSLLSTSFPPTALATPLPHSPPTISPVPSAIPLPNPPPVSFLSAQPTHQASPPSYQLPPSPLSCQLPPSPLSYQLPPSPPALSSPPSALITPVPPTPAWSSQWEQAEKEQDWLDQDWCGVEPKCPPPFPFTDAQAKLWAALSPGAAEHPPLPYEHNIHNMPSYPPLPPPPGPPSGPHYIGPPSVQTLDQDAWDQDFEPYETCEVSSNSFSDFMRGAHRAPHSSETDLDIKCGCDAAPLHSLSARQLRVALRLHAAALRRLLAEHTYRDTLYAQDTVHRAASVDSLDLQPTHDTEWVGRGRARNTHTLIRIDAGRPYRL